MSALKNADCLFFLGGGSRGCCPSLFTVLHIIVLSKVLIDSLFFPCFSLISRRISKVLWICPWCSSISRRFASMFHGFPWFLNGSQWCLSRFLIFIDFHWIFVWWLSSISWWFSICPWCSMFPRCSSIFPCFWWCSSISWWILVAFIDISVVLD